MAQRRQTFDDWIQPTDAEQMQFCVDYLRGKRKLTRIKTMGDALADVRWAVRGDNNPSELFSHMRNAWSAKKCRKKKKGTQLLQFRLTNQAVKALEQQAHSLSCKPADFVQLLVLDNSSIIQQLREVETKRLEERNDREVKRLRQKVETAQLPQPEPWARLELNAELKQLKTEVAELKQISAALIEKMGSMTTMPEACGVAESTNTIENNGNPAADNTGI